MKKITLLIFIAITHLIVGCGGSKPSGSVNLVAEASAEIIEMEPDWWSNPVQREGYISGKGEGVSRDKAGAKKKAMNIIINDFRQKTKSIAEGRSEDFFKETGENADSEIMQTFESTQISIWNGSIENWVEFKSTTVVEKTKDSKGKPRNIYRHYLVGGIDQGAADKKLLAAIKREKALITAFEQTKSYEKLQADLEKYRDRLE